MRINKISHNSDYVQFYIYVDNSVYVYFYRKHLCAQIGKRSCTFEGIGSNSQQAAFVWTKTLLATLRKEKFTGSTTELCEVVTMWDYAHM